VAMLGLKTLPVNHPLRRIYQVVAGVVGVLLVVFGVLGLIVSGDILRIPASTPFTLVCLVAGAILVAAALAGGDPAAVTNAWVGALLLVLGLACLLTMHSADANFLDVSMADVTILFLAGMILLAAGFYGRTTPVVPDAGH
jgi:drug/metabolite transporter (DMT)-like permease